MTLPLSTVCRLTVNAREGRRIATSSNRAIKKGVGDGSERLPQRIPWSVQLHKGVQCLNSRPKIQTCRHAMRFGV